MALILPILIQTLSAFSTTENRTQEISWQTSSKLFKGQISKNLITNLKGLSPDNLTVSPS
jgi:hypothetical protein